MSQLTAEERALLAAEIKPARGRRAAAPVSPRAPLNSPAAMPETAAEPAVRGHVSPAQWDDDGWDGLPVQMRG